MATNKNRRRCTYNNHESNDSPEWFVFFFASAIVVAFVFAILFIGNEIRSNVERYDGQLISGMEKYNEQ